MKHFLNVLNSCYASTLRKWRGSMSRPYTTAYPAQLLELYDRETHPECRLVREALTELDLDALIYPCPEGGERYADKLLAISGGSEIPFLFDPNSNTKLTGGQAISEHLFNAYAQRPTPAALQVQGANLLQSEKATALRKDAGLQKQPSKPAQQLLTLYSFESSPFSRLVREKLCELELAYTLINLSKQKVSDVGPAALHLSWGKYKPLENTKRAEFHAQHGNVQVPYLVDPNTQTSLFESKDILQYLDKTYAEV